VAVQLIIVQYSREKSWGFPIFICALFEVVSDDDGSYTLRVLLEAIAVANLGSTSLASVSFSLWRIISWQTRLPKDI